MHDEIIRLMFQLAIILAAAKIGGEIAERFLKIPSVLGELAAGILIGPFALGSIDIWNYGPMFPIDHSLGSHSIPVSQSMWSIAQVGSVILLFGAGLETDLRQFLRYAKPALVVAIGGVILPFALGSSITVLFGFADGFSDPKALFMGTILTATSIGISVRILGDMRVLDTPEGITTLAAAVVDDILGILILTVVIGIHLTGGFSASTVGIVALKTVGFWLVLTGLGLFLSKHISKFFDRFRVSGAALALSLALAFLAAALAESFGLAMIIGAFSIGLALSGTPLAHRLDDPLRGVYNALVPVFFVVMGMMVDVTELGDVWVFGLVVSALAAVGKIAGSGLPSLMFRFSRAESWRIGVGMMPRGEVALIMGGVAFGQGLIGQDLFSVCIIMTIITTLLAPLILVRSFKKKST
ncbi:MAG: sodium:proton exchanger [Dehalococcoidia bacterium]|nr:sodium:proton exchanger [Dehalococcoidia bacterium]